MGYSDNEILFEKGYVFLRLMLADKVVDVYLTDEERDSVPVSEGGSYLDANDPENTKKIMENFREKGVLKKGKGLGKSKQK